MADENIPGGESETYLTPSDPADGRRRYTSSRRATDGLHGPNLQGRSAEPHYSSSRYSFSHQGRSQSRPSAQGSVQNGRRVHFHRHNQINTVRQDDNHPMDYQRAPLLPNPGPPNPGPPNPGPPNPGPPNPGPPNPGPPIPALLFNRYLHASLCLPDSEDSKWCKFRTIGALFCHLLILAHGITFIIISVMSIGDSDHKKDYFSQAKVLCCLVGIFFILVFLYWILVSFCTFAEKCNPRTNCKICGLYSLWFFLFVTMIVLLSTLLLQTIDYKENSRYYFTCNKTDSNRLGDEPKDQKFCLNFVVIWALAAIILYALCHVIAFIVIAAKTGVEYLWQRYIHTLLDV